MLSTNAFNYVNVLDKAADASWRRESLLADNIANNDTPGYKRKDLDFQSILREELIGSKYESLDTRISKIDLTDLNPMTFTDISGYDYRYDENNVDIEVEQVELASEQIRYQAVAAGINQEFSRMRAVIKS